MLDRTARGLIVASIATARSVAQMPEIRIVNRRDDDAGTRGWRRIQVTPEGEQPPDRDRMEAVRSTIGSVVGLNEVTYRAVSEDTADDDPYVQVLLGEAREAGFRDPVRLLSYAPVVAEYRADMSGNAPEQRTFDMDSFESAIALY